MIDTCLHTVQTPMEVCEGTGGAPFFQFPHLSKTPGLFHGVFTRIGGVGAGNFESLNTAFGAGDDKKAVLENRRRIQVALGGNLLVFTRQTHGDKVVAVGKDETRNYDGDALVTVEKGIGLVIQTADCQSVLIYDPEKKAVAAVHSGWRGSVHNIVGKTVDYMVKRLGSRPENMAVGVGPSLGPCCGEFTNFKNELPEALWRFETKNRHFDFWAVTKDQLTEKGVLPGNIISSDICTKCRTDLFFSYRKEKITGRFASVIGLAPD